ncbi:unnamed protein product [Euphydryas editha]|uniref:Uncharacterized protein n=1 Tax=Euphydryas editha TaxID=104508 RepID=A0AAU9T9U3_EUPED|nr:unnamed protein product [Euphydryas editha]
MAPLVVEGETLGQIHQNYNEIVSKTTLEVIPEINYDESDLDNFLKIDIACNNRNVDYILKVLQCEDMLYVSRTIKRSSWLTTNQQYADIINPTYLNDHLSPKMMSKAFNKFLLHVRLNLKDERRVEEFFNYYEKTDLQTAFKWLLNCSNPFIEQIVHKHVDIIPFYLIKRLSNIVRALKTNVERYMDVAEVLASFEIPCFGPKATELLMQTCSQRVMDNFEKYSGYIHVPTFVKFIKQEELKDFIAKYIKNRKMRDWLTFFDINSLLNAIPIEDRFEFIKELFINRNQDEVIAENMFWDEVMYRLYIIKWYSHASFDTAFVDLTKLVTSKSDAREKTAMLSVLVTCARDDMKNIHTLLKYFLENYINEPFGLKTEFAYDVTRSTNTHRFDQETWGYLNELFRSIDVYNEFSRDMYEEHYQPHFAYPHSTTNAIGKFNRPTHVQDIVRVIILYHVIRDENVPNVIEKKLKFDTFKHYQKNLSEEEKDKVFIYLLNHLMTKIDTRKINVFIEYLDALDVLQNLFKLLVDWNKDLQNFQIVLHVLKEMIQICLRTHWIKEISRLYNYKKSWRKLLFTESIILNPTHEACINALKYGPELLKTYKNDVESLWLTDIKKFDKFFKKVRVYWPQSLADTYKDFFINKIDQKNTQQTAIIGLFTLLPKNDFLNFVHKYMPNGYKIDWNETDDSELNLRKHIASSLHLARPQTSPAVILSYAKGDYRQFVLPSLYSILSNVSIVQSRGYLTKLLDAPMSLKKHGIRVAYAKLEIEELKKLFSDIWKTSKNSSIRAAVFNKTFDLLCKQTQPTAIREVWELFSVFIDSLTLKENKRVYSRLNQIEKVPKSVRPEFFMKSYKFLKSSPAKDICDDLLTRLSNISDLMEHLDNDFVAEIFFELFEEKFIRSDYKFLNLFVEFLLSTKTEEAHIAR